VCSSDLATSSNVIFGATPAPPTAATRDVSAGDSHTCAIDRGGGVSCWGSNDRGESGQSSLGVRATGLPVPGLAPVAEVAAGSRFTCARTLAGRVDCFGANESGQCGAGLGSPDIITAGSQRRAAVMAGAEEITAGQSHACARLGTQVWCWGANAWGQVGAPIVAPAVVPTATRVLNLGDVTQVQAGGAFTCARASGRVWCWGANPRGQLGNGTFADSVTPVEVRLPRDEVAAELAVGEEHACARTLTARVFCWGSNHLGQLGQQDPLSIPRAEPLRPLPSNCL
jgi:alpha-tubulin suppressor-like RCC1 family protein